MIKPGDIVRLRGDRESFYGKLFKRKIGLFTVTGVGRCMRVKGEWKHTVTIKAKGDRFPIYVINTDIIFVRRPRPRKIHVERFDWRGMVLNRPKPKVTFHTNYTEFSELTSITLADLDMDTAKKVFQVINRAHR